MYLLNSEFPGIQDESLLELNPAKQSVMVKTVISEDHIIPPILLNRSVLHNDTMSLQSQLHPVALSVLQYHVSVLNVVGPSVCHHIFRPTSWAIQTTGELSATPDTLLGFEHFGCVCTWQVWFN